jgi:2-succinyl-5-enolpyruvyl-6-hydroxy-3-cyclohexene-1-carboxylate synthase
LAVAAGLLEPHGLDLFTGVDERSAAFLALGLGRADGLPAAVITTSGTAVANLLPAVVEADHGSVPLLVLSADRPERLKGIGANQTVNQEQFLAPCCRRCLQADAAGIAAMAPEALESLARQAFAACLQAPAGAVHLNLPVEEPLHVAAAAIEALAASIGRAVRSPQPALQSVAAAASEAAALSLLDPDRPGAVVVGPWRGPAQELAPFAEALQAWQRRSGWPVLADGLSGLRGWPGLELIHAYDLLLADGHRLPAAPQLLRLGPLPASRRLQSWIQACPGPQLLIAQADPRNLDATGTASLRLSAGLPAWFAALPEALRQGSPPPANRAWAERWRQHDCEAQTLLDHGLDLAGTPSEPALARRLSCLLPPGLPVMLASSSPVRDWESFAAAAAPHRPVFGFRGASGIDGTLSLAAGLAISHGRLVLLSGDLALLHDANGWLWLKQLRQRGVVLTVVLVENGGGGIFEQLPIRAGAQLDFERLFAMPQGIDQLALARAYGAEGRRLTRLDQLPAALAWAAGQPLALLELRTDRRADAQLRQDLRRRMAAVSPGADAGSALS